MATTEAVRPLTRYQNDLRMTMGTAEQKFERPERLA